MRRISIYLLVDPLSNEARYVGQTICSVRYRLGVHIKRAKTNTSSYVGAWIKSLLVAGARPECVTLEAFEESADADEAERFWIEYFRSIGCRLVNRAEGGGRNRGWRHTAETREKWRRERCGENAPRYGKAKTPEELDAISRGMKRAWQSRPHPQLGRRHTDEQRAHIKAGRAKNPPKQTEQARQARADAMTRRWQDPVWRERFSQLTSGERNPRFGKPILPHVREAVRAAAKAQLGRRRGPRKIKPPEAAE